MPEPIADHARLVAAKRGLNGTLGRLIDVLEFAWGKMDLVSIHLLLENVGRRISFRGRGEPAADLATMTPGECLPSFLRELVSILGDEHKLTETPGYEAIKRRSQYVKTTASSNSGAGPDYAAVKRGDVLWDDSNPRSQG